MARSDARLIRFAAVAAAVLLTIFILSKGSTTTYVPSTSNNNNQQSSNAAPVDPALAAAQKEKQEKSEEKTKAKTPAVGSGGKVAATFVSLARNQDLWSLIGSIRSVEDRFNRQFKHDWVFLNDEPFTEEFKRVTSALVSGNTKYGLIPKEHWSFPEWIDLEKAAATREEMKKNKIIYGDSISYRHMCRYESGFFYRHELLQDYEYYWRVEPDVKIYCDIDYDIFQWMKDNNKQYGFTISLHEYAATIETLWQETRTFIKEHPEYLPADNMMDFVSDDGGFSYNLCHFWSNFEIGNLNFWRGKAYSDYFEHLDKAGGFFYERWGDAPVHSIAAALFLPRDQVHYFPDVGYYHVPFHNCPIDDKFRLEHKCMCNPKDDFTFRGYSCGQKFHTVNKLEKPSNWQDYS
ncbi:Glycolipid 2-alpha-mannosyltransferase [Wickerhamomyces ciferrii]|uniref:Glycolipid 2-alpha-mannosyltransferase n=1 Tax=Wickerhamomyces ciferrii (strain ATCC 14091 / BCRC 22168 / CBS 111 / JCM 3599 / NBRC 0793 / NRRL Y-1031 F-60-10) TaxID=1206466 RepID=K0KSY0_WICCF|nr:Glycolipid 2-alpha-mannosyltransferase [Wickerhamomyces ciferrii]CCH45157.1 Glycolipid 2-alpha-mannosyltransferase [Wickerhamomyces ciferrii]